MNNDSENLILQINEYTKKCRLFMGYLYVCCLKIFTSDKSQSHKYIRTRVCFVLMPYTCYRFLFWVIRIYIGEDIYYANIIPVPTKGRPRCIKKINILHKKKKIIFFLYTVNISIRIEIKSFVQQKNPTLYKLPMRCEIYGHHI